MPRRAAIRFVAEELQDEAGLPIAEARVPDSVFSLSAPEGIEAGDFLRVRKEDK